MTNGLAVYAFGDGPPVFFMPYPHGFAWASTSESRLAEVLVDTGHRVITFDPPGSFRSTRPALVTIDEMLGCALEAYAACGVDGAIPVLGHSMGGLCAIAQTLAHPRLVSKLLLIDSVSGGPAVRGRGMPWGMRITDPAMWRFLFLAFRLSIGWGSMASHKRLLRIMWRQSYVDKSLVPDIEITREDARLPAPERDRWPRVALRLDYSGRLGEIRIPAFIGVGRHDPQSPVDCSRDLAAALPHARFIVFERSGHYPYIEERDLFSTEISAFLRDAS